MADPDIAPIFARLLEHPLAESPYDKIRYLTLDHKGRPLYAITGKDGVLRGRMGARRALEEAAREWSAQCFYHRAECEDNPDGLLVTKRQCDHVLASTREGEEDLHNLVLCCEHANSRKGALPICEFDRDNAQRYLAGLSRHLSRALRGA